MDYSKSKFDSATSEACYTLANHGLGHDFTDASGRNHMLVDYSPVLLMNVEADADLIARLRAETNSMSGTGWITEDTDGNVSIRMAALSGFDRPVVDGFEKAQREADDEVAIDTWLRIPEGEEESEAEANTYMTETGYCVKWYLTSVGLVTSVDFDTLSDAYDWLEAEGFANYTS